MEMLTYLGNIQNAFHFALQNIWVHYSILKDNFHLRLGTLFSSTSYHSGNMIGLWENLRTFHNCQCLLQLEEDLLCEKRPNFKLKSFW